MPQATDGAFVNGMWYFYVTVGKGWDRVAVVSSKSVFGPWHDPIGKPLLSVALSHTLSQPTALRDPCVFMSPDGKDAYIVAGVFEYYIAKLKPDMVSLAENLTLITVWNPSGPNGYGRTDDKPFIHTHNGLHYLSWGCFYSISNTGIYGPYTYAGSVLDPSVISKAFKMGTMPASLPPGPFTPPQPCMGASHGVWGGATGSNGDSVCGCVDDVVPGHNKPGELTLACKAGSKVSRVLFASIGTPHGNCTAGFTAGSCHGDPAAAMAYVTNACVGKAACQLTADIAEWDKGADPCTGVKKNIAVEVECSNSSSGDAATTTVVHVGGLATASTAPSSPSSSLPSSSSSSGGGGSVAAGGTNCDGNWCRDTNYADRHGSFLDHLGQSYFGPCSPTEQKPLFRVPLCATRTLSAIDHSRVTLSPRWRALKSSLLATAVEGGA